MSASVNFHVVLVNPEIPQNTGNIARLTAATCCHLHLIEPLGFEISDRAVKRAGLDYWPEVNYSVYANWDTFLRESGLAEQRMCFFTTKVEQRFWDTSLISGDVLVFGCETKGLPTEIHERYPTQRRTLPLYNEAVRSLNLSNAVAVAVYEGLRQLDSRL